MPGSPSHFARAVSTSYGARLVAMSEGDTPARDVDVRVGLP